MAKPGDFFVGVTDLFSVLLPGAIVACMLRVAGGDAINGLFGLSRLEDTPVYAAFLVAAYILGNLTDMIGSVVVDQVYDLTYAEYKRSAAGLVPWLLHAPRDIVRVLSVRSLHTFLGWPLGEHAEVRVKDPLFIGALAEAPGLPHGERLYQWCRDWLQLHSPQALAEPDRLQANSKFFRGLVVLTVVFVLLLTLSDNLARAAAALAPRSVLLALTCAIGLAAFLRYCDLRWKAVHQVYRLYIISQQAAPKPVANSVTQDSDSE